MSLGPIEECLRAGVASLLRAFISCSAESLLPCSLTSLEPASASVTSSPLCARLHFSFWSYQYGWLFVPYAFTWLRCCWNKKAWHARAGPYLCLLCAHNQSNVAKWKLLGCILVASYFVFPSSLIFGSVLSLQTGGCSDGVADLKPSAHAEEHGFLPMPF